MNIEPIVVSDEESDEESEHPEATAWRQQYADGWNACLEAIKAATPQEYEPLGFVNPYAVRRIQRNTGVCAKLGFNERVSLESTQEGDVEIFCKRGVISEWGVK
jgi:hypothetical protein